ncbi:MAG: UPF0182 family protein [Anaerolineae bacterium]
MFKNKGCVVGLGLLVVGAVLFFTLLDFYADLAWFETLGVTSVLWKRIVSEWVLFLAAWLVASGVMVGNWWLARRLAGVGQMTLPWLRQRRTRNQVTAEPTTRVVAAKVADAVLAAAAVGMGFLFALPARGMWMTALRFLNSTPFGQIEPVLGRDIGYYLFDLPWLSFLQGWLLWLVLVSLVGVALVYLASYSAERLMARVEIVGERQPWLRLTRAAERHLLVLGAVALGLFAWGYRLNMARLLYSTAGASYGAAYTDVHARLPVMTILTVIAIAGAVILLVSMFVRVRWLPYAVVGAWLLVALVGGALYPSLLQRLAVVPNELTREREYIERTIGFTQAAYGLDQIAEADFDVVEEAVPLDLEANSSTIKNIRLWDYRPLLRTYSQLQEIRLYYAFTDVDVDRYWVADDYRQVTLVAREIASDELPQTAQTWVNRHLIYTHGSGVVLSPVNEVLEEGLPNLWVRDIPPETVHPELAVTRPEIYFGELTDDYVIVKTEELELDYPSGDKNVYATYEGAGGVVLDSFLKRLAYALRLGSSQILLSDSLTSESRLLWRRAIDERVRTLAPFLAYDPDPYMAIVGGRLVWLQDAYTITDRYPYSEPIDTSFGRINYIRNSVKIAMDAYDGTVSFYLIDPEDPIAATYAAIFPDLFQPGEEMDPVLVEHWRYPEAMFRIQAAKYQTFHMEDPQVFYNQEDLWNWAEEVVTGERMRIEPYYVIMRLPGESAEEFVLMMPYTPSSKQNMVAWLYARNDGEHYGKLGVYKFPKQRLVYGPMQIESRIDQDPVISQQLSLWNQRGSQVIRGNLLVIPIDRSILYVEPIYLEAEASQLPELRRVIVAYGNHIAMEETLGAALARVMGVGLAEERLPDEGAEVPSDGPVSPLGEDLAALVQQADSHYQAAQECLQLGDWTCYGREMDALELVLEALVAATEE